MENFCPYPKRQTKHSAASRVGATADMMRHWYGLKLSLEDICDSKSKKLISVKKEDNMSLNNRNKRSIEEQDIPDVVISKICKNEERRINIKFSKEMGEEILSGNCLSDITINLGQIVIHKQFLSINGLEYTELGLRMLFSIRKGKFLQILFGDYHWITLCETNEAEVSVYDSLSKGSVNSLNAKVALQIN